MRNILSGVWMIERSYAESFLPIVANLIDGKSVMVDAATVASHRESQATTKHSSRSNRSNMSSMDSYVAVIQYKDPVIKYAQECGPLGTERLAKEIRMYGADPNCMAIVLDMDSGGGAADAIQNPAAAINEVKQNKPVIGYAGNGMVASAAYGIMSACTEIYATYVSDQIGSIGTYMTMVDMAAAISAKLGGARVEYVYAKASSAKNKEYREFANDNKTDLAQADVDLWNNNFISMIKTNRPGKVSDDAFDGRLVMATDAMSLGMIDGMKTFDEVIHRAQELAQSESGGASNKNNNVEMKIFVKNMDATIDAINAGTEVDNESLTAANAELESQGLSLVRLSELGNNNDTAALQESVSNLTTTNESLTNQLAALKNERNAVAVSVGLSVAENGDLIDQNNDPVQLIDSVNAVVDQRDAYGRKAGVLEVATSEKQELETTDEFVDPSMARMEEVFGKE